MSRLKSALPRRGEVVFPRFGHKRVGYETPRERDFLLLSRQRGDIVDLDRNTIILVSPHNRRSTLRPSFLLHHATGSRELVVVGRRQTSASRPSHSDAFPAVASKAGLGLRFVDASTQALEGELKTANLIEAGGTRRLPNGWSQAGYEALYTGNPDSITDLEAMLPAGVDALAVALRLAWLGEIAFEGHGPIRADRRFRHTPVRAATPSAAALAQSVR